MENNQKTKLLIIIFLLALIVRGYGIKHGMPYSEVFDEENLVRATLDMGRYRLDPKHYYVPHLMFNLTFPAMAAYYGYGRLTGAFASPLDLARGFFRDITPFFVIARLVTALFSSLTIVFLTFFLWDLFGRRAALIGALALIFFPLEVMYAHIFRPEVFLHFGGMGAIYFSYRLIKRREWRYFLGAGFWVGLAWSSKYSGIAYGLFYLLGFVLADGGFKQVFNKLAIIKYISGLVMIVITFVVASPYTFISFEETLRCHGGMFSHVTTHGHLGFESTNAWRYYFTEAMPQTMSWPLMILAIAGMLIALIRHKKVDIFFLVFTVTFYYYIGSWQTTFPRYYYPLILPFIYFIVIAFETAFNKINFFQNNYIAQIFLVVLFLSRPAYMVIMANHYKTLPSTRVLAKEWVEANLPSGSKIVMEEKGPHIIPAEAEYESRLKRLRAKGRKGLRIQYLLENYDENTPNYDWIYLWKKKPKDPIKYVEENDFDYAIISERKYGAAYHRDSMILHPDQTHYYRRYYDYLWANYPILKEFIPASPYARGSRIVIFQLSK